MTDNDWLAKIAKNRKPNTLRLPGRPPRLLMQKLDINIKRTGIAYRTWSCMLEDEERR